MTDDALLPCPFCEGNALLRTGDSSDFYFVECESCGCETAPQDTPSMAYEKWNTRPKSLGRDEIAKIIDPRAFMTIDEQRADSYQQRKQVLAFERADAILGIKPPPQLSPARQWDDVLKRFRYPDED